MKHIFLILGLYLFSACSDRPAREKFPGPQGRTTELQQSETQRAMLGGFDSLNSPFEQRPVKEVPRAATGDAQSTGPSIEGEIFIQNESAATAVLKNPASTLFIAARPRDGGPPIAVLKIAAPKFPYKFALTKAHVMMAGTTFEGDVTLSIRLDQDGNPLSREPGDWGHAMPTKVGAKNLKIYLKPENN